MIEELEYPTIEFLEDLGHLFGYDELMNVIKFSTYGNSARYWMDNK